MGRACARRQANAHPVRGPEAMKRSNLRHSAVAELVERFAAICVEQNRTLLEGDIAKFRRLFNQMKAITDELKSRPGDQRNALLALFVHPDMQVRLQAGRAALAVAPKESRRLIEAIAGSHRFPQAGDAGMCLWTLDEGILVPK